jgi:hypothetical protein
LKKIILLILFTAQAKAFTVLNERTWCTGNAKCNSQVEIKHINGVSPLEIEISKASVILKNQTGYEGIEIELGATHNFYIYNGTPADVIHVVKASLCDAYQNCFFYEKEIRMRWREVYSEKIYSSLRIFRETIGYEPIFANSEITFSPTDEMHAEATLLVEPFPYDQ